MAYSLSNKCAKNLCKRADLGQLIIKNVVTRFLEHNVVIHVHANLSQITLQLCCRDFRTDDTFDWSSYS